MRAEVISIGDELTSGQRLDTNSQWLSQQLGEVGIRVLYHTTVADDLTANQEAFRLAAGRADVVISTGGLGPTADDLTREALAGVLGVPLVLDEPSLAHIRQLFERRSRTMPERNNVQAMFPAGTVPIPNPSGTAPGIAVRLSSAAGHESNLFALPGVPAEMKEMWHATVRPRLLGLLPAPRMLRYRCLKCFGVGESELEQMLPDMIRRGRVPTVGITVSRATISLRIAAEGSSDAECEQLIEPTVTTIRQHLGQLVFGEGEDELEHAVLRGLARLGRSLAVVECGTEGLLGQWLAAAHAVAPSAFRGSMYLPAAEIDLPGADRSGPSDPRTIAARLATDVRSRFAADYGLALGPWPVDAGDASGARVPFALATADNVHTHAASTAGHPELLQARAAKQALNVLRLRL